MFAEYSKVKVEFDAVAKKLARLRTAELKVHGEMRLLKAYGSSPIKLV
jgi:hypothetical protein